MDTLEQLLAQLEQLVFNAKKSMFSASDATVNRNEVLDLLARIRAAYPEVMREAQYIVSDCENQKQKALEYGSRLIKEAESRRNQLLDESDILVQAKAEADEIVKKAYDLRNRLEFEVKCRVDEVLKDSEVTLRDALTLIRNNREELRESMAADRVPQEEPEADYTSNPNA